MADWLLNAGRRLQLTGATIDILKERIEPEELNLYPLLINIKELKPIIEREVISNGFPADFIVEAKIRIEFLDPVTYKRTIYCYPYLIDKDGCRYEPGRIIESAYGDYFDPFDPINIYPVKPSNFFPGLNEQPKKKWWIQPLGVMGALMLIVGFFLTWNIEGILLCIIGAVLLYIWRTNRNL
jgi:hypothetical protein